VVNSILIILEFGIRFVFIVYFIILFCSLRAVVTFLKTSFFEMFFEILLHFHSCVSVVFVVFSQNLCDCTTLNLEVVQ